MCQHALCEHNNNGTLSPIAPPVTFGGKCISCLTMVAPLFIMVAALYFTPRWLLPSLPVQFAALAVLVAFLLYQSWSFPVVQLSDKTRQTLHADASHQAFIERCRDEKRAHAYCQRLSEVVQIPTVSFDKTDTKNTTDLNTFLAMHRKLEQLFPLVHSKLEKKVINTYSLVYKWKGRNSGKQKPYLLIAHLDVVPVPDAHLWNVPPFSGKITKESEDGGFIHGRGSIDDKQAVIGILSAVEDLLETGFVPDRDLYVAFGHDEEVSGYDGAAHVAEWFKSQKLHFEFMLDEGLFVMNGILPGLKQEVAMVCVAEKGFLVSEYNVVVSPDLAGHASAPSSQSAIGILCSALLKMERNPMPAYLIRGSPARMLFEYLAPHFNYPFRLLFSNLWLFAPVLKLVLTMKNTTATMVRTTTALTIIQAGTKANVVPREASAVINHRIHPFDSVDGVLAYSNKVVNDKRVEITNRSSIPPAPVSSTTSEGFKTIQAAVARALPDVLVAPTLMVGNTDTHHYWGLCEDIYRFTPTRMTNENVSMFHGVNEKMKISNFLETIGFYRSVIQLADEGAFSAKKAVGK